MARSKISTWPLSMPNLQTGGRFDRDKESEGKLDKAGPAPADEAVLGTNTPNKAPSPVDLSHPLPPAGVLTSPIRLEWRVDFRSGKVATNSNKVICDFG